MGFICDHVRAPRLAAHLGIIWACILTGAVATPAVAADRTAPSTAPATGGLSEPASVYAPDEQQRQEEEDVNRGGVNVDVVGRYLSDYVFRGIDFSKHIDPQQPLNDVPSDAPNYQADAKLTFDLGKAPHPFIGVFMNIFNDDEVSRFQEVRPYIGADWRLRPLRIGFGATNYTYPEREKLNTSELWFRVGVDDSKFFNAERPVIAPYFFAAFDVHRYWGWYFEWGVQHDFEIEQSGVTLTPFADVAYVAANGMFAADFPTGWDVGWQHYDVGMDVDFDLNDILNGSPRYGHWIIEGTVTYTGEMCNHLRSDTRLWGGAGLRFQY